MELSELIKKEREKLNISQRELAKRIKVDNALISRIENGNVTQPNYLVLLKLSIELKLDIIDLMILANYDEMDIALLQDIDYLKYEWGMSKEEKEIYLKNGIIDFNKVVRDCKDNKINESQAIGLFIEELRK